MIRRSCLALLTMRAYAEGSPKTDGYSRTVPLPKASGRIILGIETSCDETAVALVGDDRVIIAERVFSQLAEHAPYGGVVPEIAARAHVERLDRLVTEVMQEAALPFNGLSGVAATAGPGLIGGLVVGLVTAKVIAATHDLPLLAINHLEAHALTPRLTEGLDFPYLLLLVSGGHCQLVLVLEVGRYRRLGTTIDDAVGEAFDKVAKMLGLGYPGGPRLEAEARDGDPRRLTLPRPLAGQPGCDFSFSGLKTAVRMNLLELGPAALEPPLLADVCASFQAAVADVLVDRTRRALALVEDGCGAACPLVVAGGVAANLFVRQRLAELCETAGRRLVAPPLRLCSDNAAMVAWAGIERLELGHADPLTFKPRARWPLDPAAEPRMGTGFKGPKA
jgi:N6-L-threonylcarbamoyladenine synthase